MAKTNIRANVRRACTERVNYRVVVTPEGPLGPRPARQSECESLIKDIRRHVDDVSGVYVDFDIACKFCGYGWDAALDDDGKPACCMEAIAEFDRLVQEVQDGK